MHTQVNSAPEVVQAPLVHPEPVTVVDGTLDYQYGTSRRSDIDGSLDRVFSDYYLMKIQAKYSNVKPLSLCGRSGIKNKSISYSNKGGKLTTSGVHFCGNGLCRRCSPYKINESSVKIATVMEDLKDSKDFYLGTLTIPSNKDIVEQLKELKKVWKTFQGSMVSSFNRRNIKIDISWSLDVTVNVLNGGMHLHKHCIVMVDKGKLSEAGIEEIWKDKWIAACGRQETPIKASRAAQYLKRAQSSEGAAKYLMKSVVECMGSARKSSSYDKHRVGIFGLLRLIAKTNSPKIIKYYQKLVGAFYEANIKWSRVGNKICSAYRDILAKQEDEKADSEKCQEEDQEPTVVIDNVAPHTHRIIFDSGVMGYLAFAFKIGVTNESDSIVYLRDLISEINKCKYVTISIDRYIYYCKELQWWASNYYPDQYRLSKDQDYTYV